MLRQVLVFGLVGLTATATHYGVAFGLSEKVTPYVANFAGFLAAIGVSYLGHLRLTFKLGWEQADHSYRLPRFLFVAVSGFALSQLALAAALGPFRLPLSMALGVAVIAVPTFTFLVSRLWVFRHERIGGLPDVRKDQTRLSKIQR